MGTPQQNVATKTKAAPNELTASSVLLHLHKPQADLDSSIVGLVNTLIRGRESDNKEIRFSVSRKGKLSAADDLERKSP